MGGGRSCGFLWQLKEGCYFTSIEPFGAHPHVLSGFPSKILVAGSKTSRSLKHFNNLKFTLVLTGIWGGGILYIDQQTSGKSSLTFYKEKWFPIPSAKCWSKMNWRTWKAVSYRRLEWGFPFPHTITLNLFLDQPQLSVSRKLMARYYVHHGKKGQLEAQGEWTRLLLNIEALNWSNCHLEEKGNNPDQAAICKKRPQ